MGGRDGSRLGPVRVPRTRKGRTLRSKKLLATAGVLTLVLPVSVATADETGGESGIGGLAVPAPDGEISPDAAQEFFESQSKSTVMVELQGDPVAVTEAKTEGSLSEAQEKDIESKLESDQGQVAKAIEAKGGQVEGQMQSAFNGMRVTIDNNELESLRSVPGVKAVHSIPVYERSNTASVPSLGVPKIWEGSGGSTGYTGEGVKVAVIDSGIDYTHATFGGPGTADAYQEQAAADAQDKPNPAWYGPDAPHVKGGVDFVGDDYNGKNQPKPDNNPLDCTKQGHGTHVAATLGGGGVLADGQAYSGSYDQKTHENQFKVGPGVAPKADLYAARVFGCTGYTTFIPEAIDWAVKNKMDVINLSIGAAFGKATDPGAIAAANAVASGVVVVAASGNSGEQPYITSEPGVGAGVISVAATDPSRDGGYGTFSSAGPRSGDSGLRPGVAAPGVNISSAAVGSGNDAKPRSGTSMATPQVAGVAALAVQAHPGWNAQEISSALVSTADPGKVSGYSPTRGGGLIDPTEATSAQVLAFGDSTDIDDKVVRDPVLSFGYHESNDTFQETRTITLVNKGDSEATFSGSVKAADGSLPAQVSLNTDQVTIPAGGTAEVEVNLTLKASEIPSSYQENDKSLRYQEASGNVEFTSGDRSLNVPYLMVPRSTTNVTGQISDASKISFQNQDGTYEAKGMLFNWGITDPQDDLLADESTDDAGVDIANVGVQSGDISGEKHLAFAINSHTRHSNAASNRYEVSIDNNGDGKADYSLVSLDSGKVMGKNYNGIPEVFICDLARNRIKRAQFRTIAPTDSSTVILMVKASEIGVNGKIEYWADTSNLMHGSDVRDRTDQHGFYDPSNRPFNDGQIFQVAPGGSQDVDTSYNKTAYEEQGSLGWMAVVFDNGQGTAEAVTGSLSGDGGSSPSPSSEPTVTPTSPEPSSSASPGEPTGSPSQTDPTDPVTPDNPGLDR